MTDEERLEKIAIKAFQQHWGKIVKTLEKGKNTYIDKRYGCFEAGTAARQKILANRFYGLDHARKMATLSEKAIKSNLLCYLPKAIEYALFENDESAEQEAFMKRLVSSEYVIFRSGQCVSFECFDEDAADLWVSEYPAAVYYDDWYEGSIGADQCQTSILMKSTGEAFSKTEVRWLKESIRHNIDGNDSSAFWWFGCEQLVENKLWVKIYNFDIDKDRYVEEVLIEDGALHKGQFKEFVRQLLEHLYKDEDIRDKLSVFKNYKSMTKKKLHDITDDFLEKNWETGVLSDYDIRTAENIINRMRGRKDRDYHFEVVMDHLV